MEHITVADLIDNLFRTCLKEDGQQYSMNEVATGIERLGFGTLTASYIAKLRRGDIVNPGRDVLMKLCLFFNVPGSYFFPELEQVGKQQNVEHDAVTRLRIAFRSIGLDDDEREQIEGLIDILRNKRQKRHEDK